MASFLALYRGSSIATAELVTVSTNPSLIARFAGEMLKRDSPAISETHDPVRAALDEGERRALKLVREEGMEDAGAEK